MIKPESEDIAHFFSVLERYQEGTATAEEIAFVEHYLQLLEKRTVVPEDFELKKIAIYDDIKGRLLGAVAQENPPQSAGRVLSLRRYWWVAASVFVLLSAGGYFLTRQNKGNGPAQTIALADVQPGKNGAILTLASGEKVLLDSMANGASVVQGNAKLQMQNGALTYDSAASDEAVGINSITTPKGRQFQVVLPDGTRVWLNAASNLTYPVRFAKNERLVKVTGEAYFEVAQRVHQPFKVKINDRTEVQVLGTTFNINAYYDESGINTTLLSGSLKVVNGNGSKLLVPGWQATIDAGSRDIRLHEANTENVVAWKNGSFAFANADIETVMRQLARWYDITVTFDGQMPEGSFSGEIDRSLTLTQVLKGLASTRINYQLLPGNKLVIRP